MFILLLTSGWCYADCPLFTYPENHKLDQEINNICQNEQNPIFGTATGSTMTVTQLNVSTIAVTGQIDMRSKKIINQANGSASGDSAAFGQLKIIQIVPCNNSTAFSTASTSFQTTNLTCSITLSSASNKVFVLASGTLFSSVSSKASYASIFRGSTNLGDGTVGFVTTFPGTSSAVYASCAPSVLDTPGSVGPLTYSIKIHSDASGTAGWGDTNTFSHMLLAEVQ